MTEQEHDQHVIWRSPSNIAIVKYWGKRPVQIPENPSISFTLDQCHTETRVDFKPSDFFEVTLYFEGQREINFESRVKKYLLSLDEYMPWIRNYRFSIQSRNSFPHSSGIASSASSMSALALCLCEIEAKIFNHDLDDSKFRNRASFISRLGSGSACRSLFAKLSLWGQTQVIDRSSNFYGLGLGDELHDQFQSMYDSILIIDQGSKEVSSSKGHALMNGNPFAQVRYEQATKNCREVFNALQTGDIEKFGIILENEALQLHALMMCSNPSFVLMKPNSLEAINRIRAFRSAEKLPVYFTLDAGPNIHLIYPGKIREKVLSFIETELSNLCQDQYWIDDFVGSGPKKLNHD